MSKMKDPVCGANVDEKNASSSSNYKGQKYLFCGSSCKEKFDKEPERYAGQPREKVGGMK